MHILTLYENLRSFQKMAAHVIGFLVLSVLSISASLEDGLQAGN